MRMRFKPYARGELLACHYHAHVPFENKGHWHEQFARPQQPMMLELGCGWWLPAFKAGSVRSI